MTKKSKAKQLELQKQQEAAQQAQQKNKNKYVRQQQNLQEILPLISTNTYKICFEEKTKKLSSYLYYFCAQRNDYTYQTTPDKQFKDWIDEWARAHEEDIFTGELSKKILKNKRAISQSPSVDIIYVNFNYFENSLWNPRFQSKIVSKIYQSTPDQIPLLFSAFQYLLSGNLKECKLLEQNSYMPYTEFMLSKITHNKNLLFMVGVERIPIFDKTGFKINRFDFTPYMKFLDILTENEVNFNITTILHKFQTQITQDPSRQNFDDQLREVKQTSNKTYIQQKICTKLFTKSEDQYQDIITCNLRQYYNQSNNQYYNQHINNQIDQAAYFGPSQFVSEYLSQKEQESFILDKNLNRWVSADKKKAIERQKFSEYQAYINKQILKKYADFSSAAKLVELLQNIPNFKIKLTNEEMDVVGQNGNVMVIGRSGTGKTTCAILRLFSMEMLFKIRVSVYKQKKLGVIQNTEFEADDVDNIIGLHCIFVTASPVLTNEVKRYYTKLTTQIKEELEKKKQRKREERKKQQQQMQEVDEKKEQDQDQDFEEIQDKKISKTQEQQDQEFEDEMKEQLQDIQLKKQISHESQKEADDNEKDMDEEYFDNDDDDDENLATGNTEHINSLNDLKEEDFPGFFTIKRLILLVDACLSKPFFSRNNNNEIIGQDTKATWHNETKGVLQIDQYHRKVQSGKNEEEIEQLENENEEDSDLGDYEDEEELEQEYERQIQLQQKKQKQKEIELKKLKQNPYAKKMAFEIDYNYFLTYFWPTVNKKHVQNGSRVISPAIVWTEIYSFIKGSADSHNYVGWYISKYVYVYNNKVGTKMLTQEDRQTIFEIFMQYEQWKIRQGGYDLMDIVNYILVQIKYQRYHAKTIHYMMIDEVQDLPHAVLYLLMKITEQGLFFSGDTAQTIAQGVGFKFSDLSNVFDKGHFGSNYAQQAPVVKQLTVNFRSHNKILELANSIVTTIEIFFPSTIDKLKKERSNIDGPKPMLLAEADPELLFFILCGEEQFKSAMHSDNNAGSINERQPLEFGCNQVIIVRDQESKKTLPAVLQHALVLTVYEAKGLEFDDVILYNFFADSKVDQWSLIDKLDIVEEWMSKEEFNKTVTIHESQKLNKIENQGKTEEEIQSEKMKRLQELNKPKDLETTKTQEIQQQKEDEDEQVETLFGLQENEEGQVRVQKVKQMKQLKKKIDLNSYQQLCTELKQLYVAATRPKNRLIIYDDNTEKRQYFEKYWKQLQTVEIMSKSSIQNIFKEEENQKISKQQPEQSMEIKMFKTMLTQTNAQEWKKQGLKMFKHKFFEQAMKCFEKSGEKEMFTKAKAYYLADLTSKTLVEIETEYKYIEHSMMNYNKMKSSEKKKIKKELARKQTAALATFNEAAQIFYSLDKKRQAAQCYFSAKEYKKAQDIYLELNQYKQAGEAAYLLENYLDAAEYFDLGKDYLRVIECLDIENQWDKILEILQKYRSTIPQQDMDVFIRKYAPLALESLVKAVEDEEEDEENTNKNKEDSQAIREEDNEDEESEEISDESVQEEEEKQQEKTDKNKDLNEKIEEENVEDLDFSNVQQDKTQIKEENQQKSQNISDMSFSVIEGGEKSEIQNTIAQQEKNDNISQLSFSVIGGEDNQSQIQGLNASKLDDFEHLSHIDVQDEWLKMEKGSVIESLSEARKSNSNLFSEYSAVEFSQVMSQNVQLVKTKADIFIQDSTMQQIIKYIEMFSQDFQREMNNFRSAKSLMTKRKDFKDIQDSEYDQTTDFIVDLDEIDINFVYLILDTLETFKIYKLCIFVCNRYKLSQRLGRYVLSLAQKYSPLSTENAQILQSLLYAGKHRTMTLEKSFVSSVALHNILENINPVYLQGKKQGTFITPQNSLGIECYQGLVLLGYWKKILYMLDYPNALALASAFSDFKSYKAIFLSLSEKYSEKTDLIEKIVKSNKWDVDFECLPFEIPENQLEIQYSIICLEHVIWNNIQSSKLPYLQTCFLAPYYVQELTQVLNAQNSLKPKSLIQFPSFFAYNGVLWNYLYSENKDHDLMLEYIKSGFANLNKILTKPLHNFQSDLIDLRTFDLMTFAVLVCNLINSECKDLQNLIQNQMSLSEVIEMFDTIHHIFRLVNEQYTHNRHTNLLLRSLFAPYSVRLIENEEIMDLINNNHVLLHRGSSLVSDLVSFKMNKNLDIQAQVQQEYQYLNKHKQAENYNVDQEIKKRSMDQIYFADVDQDYIIAPFDVALQCIKEKLYYRVKGVINAKIQIWESQNTNYSSLVTRSDYNNKVYEIANILGLQIIRQNLQSPSLSSFKETFDYQAKIGNSTEAYKNLRPNDIVRRYMKLEAQKQQYDVVDGDEDIEEYLRNNPHLLAAQQVLKKKKKKNKKTQKNTNINDNVYTMPKEKSTLNYLLKYNVGKSEKPLNKYAREAILMLVNYYTKKGLLHSNQTEQHSSLIIHNPLIKMKKLLNFLGNDQQFYEITSKIRKNYKAPKTYYAIRQLDDMIALKELGLVSEYSDCLFNYLQYKFSVQSNKERIQTLEEAAVLNLLAYKKFHGKQCKLQLSKNMIKYIPGETNILSYNSIQFNNNKIVPFETNEIISECVFWLKKVVDQHLYSSNANQSQQTSQCYQILLIVLNIIINLDNYNGQIFDELRHIIKELYLDNPIEFKEIQYSKSFNKLLEVQEIEDLISIRDTFISKDEDDRNIFVFPVQGLSSNPLYDVEINDGHDAAKQEDKSYIEYFQEMKQITVRKQAAKVIQKFLNPTTRKNISKMRSKIIKSPIIYYTIAQNINPTTSTTYLKNISMFSLKYQSILELVRIGEHVKRQILNTFLQTYVDLALDFHYIALQLRNLSLERKNFINELNYVLQYFTESDIQKLLKNFVNYKKDMQNRLLTFMSWKDQNVKYEANVGRLLKKNKRILSVKWYNRQGLGQKAQKIIKKRAGLKKQRALQDKKSRLQFQKIL